MQSIFKLANHEIEYLLEQEDSAIYPSLHYQYIAYVYWKYCNYNNWYFPLRIFSFDTGKFTFNGMLFNANGMLFNAKRTAKFCCSVGPVFWCLFIRPPSNLPDLTGGLLVFRIVDRSVKQIKIVSYTRQKTGINSNNLSKSEESNLF